MLNLLASDIFSEDILVTVLRYSTWVLDFVGVAFALLYLILNVFTHISNLRERNVAMIKICRTTIILSVLFTFLSFLLCDPGEIETAIIFADNTFMIIALSWLAIVALCGVSMLILLIFKRKFTADVSRAIRKIFVTAFIGALVALLLFWLLS